MGRGDLKKAALLAVVLLAGSIISWELYLRSKGHPISYDDGPPLWADKRDRVYENDATVFVGSSRIKYDLDIETWENLTGSKAVMLAIQGSNPRPVLDHLANDINFKGKVILDVTEGLFFPPHSPREADVNNNLNFYKDNHTPAQRASFELNRHLESNFVFLNKNFFSLNAILSEIKLPPRKDVFNFPHFPAEFEAETFERQSYMTDRFLKDTNLQNQVKAIWGSLGGKPRPPMPDSMTIPVFKSVRASIDKIKSRGGDVVLVRTPSSGSFLMMEDKAFPRERFWDKLVMHSGSPGIHFKDYKELDHFICPELSHLSKSDAIIYTTHLVRILSLHAQWKFPKQLQTAAIN